MFPNGGEGALETFVGQLLTVNSIHVHIEIMLRPTFFAALFAICAHISGLFPFSGRHSVFTIPTFFSSKHGFTNLNHSMNHLQVRDHVLLPYRGVVALVAHEVEFVGMHGVCMLF